MNYQPKKCGFTSWLNRKDQGEKKHPNLFHLTHNYCSEVFGLVTQIHNGVSSYHSSRCFLFLFAWCLLYSPATEQLLGGAGLSAKGHHYEMLFLIFFGISLICNTPQKFNIDTKTGHIYKESPFPNHKFWASIGQFFGGVDSLKLTTCFFKISRFINNHWRFQASKNFQVLKFLKN